MKNNNNNLNPIEFFKVMSFSTSITFGQSKTDEKERSCDVYSGTRKVDKYRPRRRKNWKILGVLQKTD